MGRTSVIISGRQQNVSCNILLCFEQYYTEHTHRHADASISLWPKQDETTEKRFSSLCKDSKYHTGLQIRLYFSIKFPLSFEVTQAVRYTVHYTNLTKTQCNTKSNDSNVTTVINKSFKPDDAETEDVYPIRQM